MLRFLTAFKKNLIIAIPISILLGILSGFFFNLTFLKSAILPLTILMIYPMMVTLNPRHILIKCQPKTQIIIQVFNLIIIPLTGYLVGIIFFPNQPFMAYGLLLIALLPTSGMTISWTGFGQGNVDIAVKTTIIGLIAGSLLMPLYTWVFMGKTVSVPLLKIFFQLGKVIFLPLILGYFTQIVLIKVKGREKFNKTIKPKFPLLSTLAVLGIIFVATALKSKSIVKDPVTAILLILPVGLFYLINYVIVTVTGITFLSRKNGVAMVYGTVMRNLSVALAIALTIFGENGVEIAMIIAVAFIIQVQSAAWYLKVIKKIRFKNGNE